MTPWYIFAFLSVFFSVTYGIISKKILNDEDNHDPIAFASSLFLVVAICSGVAYLLSMPDIMSDLSSFANPQVLLILGANLSLYTIAPSIYWRALKHLPISEVSILFDLTAVYILIFGISFGTEQFSMTRLIGGLLIVGAALMLGVLT